MFEPLKKFFSSTSSCPLAIASLFEDPTSFFWLNFVENQLEVSNESILRVESSKGACFQIAAEVNVLRNKMKNRKNLKFMPFNAKTEFNKLPSAVQEITLKHVESFYRTVVEYLDLWSTSMDGTECFTWMSLIRKPSWDEVEISFDYAVKKLGKLVQDKINRKIRISTLFFSRSVVFSNSFTLFSLQLTKCLTNSQCSENILKTIWMNGIRNRCHVNIDGSK